MAIVVRRCYNCQSNMVNRKMKVSLITLASTISQNNVGQNINQLNSLLETQQLQRAYDMNLCLLFGLDNFYALLEAENRNQSESYWNLLRQLKGIKSELEDFFTESHQTQQIL